MTIRELKKEVEALGFSDLCELDGAFRTFANRALSMIHTYHPKEKLGELGYFFEAPIFYKSSLVSNGEDITLSIPKGKLSMKLQGQGEYRYTDGKKQITSAFLCAANHVTIDFYECGELTFIGGGSYSAWDITVCRKSPFPYEDAVLDMGEFQCLDLLRVFPDMLYVTGQPKDKRNNQIKNVSISDSTHIMIPKRFSGVIYLVYRAKEQLISNDADEKSQIDISHDLAPLLPLLTAFFLWLDSEPEKAEEYLKSYEKLSLELAKRRKIHDVPKYQNTSRWA